MFSPSLPIPIRANLSKLYEIKKIYIFMMLKLQNSNHGWVTLLNWNVECMIIIDDTVPDYNSRCHHHMKYYTWLQQIITMTMNYNQLSISITVWNQAKTCLKILKIFIINKVWFTLQYKIHFYYNSRWIRNW